MMINNPAYNKMYLDSNMNLHRLLFFDFMNNKEYDFFSLIDTYMQTSEIRAKMDIGNWSALNKGDKQLLNSIDYTRCKKNSQNNSNIDYFIMHWMADIYSMFQWMYAISSADINKRIPSKEMYKIYYPLHEASHKIACEKIYETYFIQNKQPEFNLEILERNL